MEMTIVEMEMQIELDKKNLTKEELSKKWLERGLLGEYTRGALEKTSDPLKKKQIGESVNKLRELVLK